MKTTSIPVSIFNFLGFMCLLLFAVIFIGSCYTKNMYAFGIAELFGFVSLGFFFHSKKKI